MKKSEKNNFRKTIAKKNEEIEGLHKTVESLKYKEQRLKGDKRELYNQIAELQNKNHESSKQIASLMGRPYKHAINSTVDAFIIKMNERKLPDSMILLVERLYIK